MSYRPIWTQSHSGTLARQKLWRVYMHWLTLVFMIQWKQRLWGCNCWTNCSKTPQNVTTRKVMRYTHLSKQTTCQEIYSSIMILLYAGRQWKPFFICNWHLSWFHSFAGYTQCISQNHQLLGTIYVFDMTTYIKLKLFLHKCIQYIECIYLLTVAFVLEYTEVCLLLSKQSFVNFNVVCHSFHMLKLFKWNFTKLGQLFNCDKAF